MALGGYCTTAVTAVTAQDTLGVHRVLPVPAGFVALQMVCVLRDIGAAVVKTGMLGDAAAIEAVAGVLPEFPGIALVVDPVMLAKGGERLLPEAALDVLKAVLAPLAALLTPNVPEAETLAGMPIRDLAGQCRAAEALLRLGSRAVLLKGGHLPGEQVTDVLATSAGICSFSATRIRSRHTHGTGCTLASAVAVGLAQGMALEDAIRRARAYVRAAVEQAPGIGGGHGPMHHGAAWREEPGGA